MRCPSSRPSVRDANAEADRLARVVGATLHRARKPPEMIRGWHLCGAGPARYGWAWQHPCSLQWLGTTKAEALTAAAAAGLLTPTPSKGAPRGKSQRTVSAAMPTTCPGKPARSTILVDEENNADQWWTAARAATDCPAKLRPIIHGGKRELRMTKADADACEAWCAKLPGWADGPEHASNALIIADD